MNLSNEYLWGLLSLFSFILYVLIFEFVLAHFFEVLLNWLELA